MLLAIDVGNTQTVIGLYAVDDDGGTGAELARPLAHRHQRRAHVRRARAAGAGVPRLPRLLASTRTSTGLAVSSVVPRVTAAVREMTERYFGFLPVVVEPGVQTGMPILYDNPKEVGADRIANAVAAYDLYGGPTIVVDFGTATTLDAVSAKGEYLGGAIVPGIEISLDALFGRAAALRRVELVEPRNVIGRNTVESIQSGAVYGFAAPGRRHVRAVRATSSASARWSPPAASAGLIAPLSTTIEHHEPWLTLHGLRLIYERTATD